MVNRTYPEFVDAATALTQFNGGETFAVVSSGVSRKASLSSFSKTYIDPHLFGAKGDAIAAVDGVLTGTQLSSATYQFVASDVGKLCFINDIERTIASVAAGVATLSSGVYDGTNFRWLIGTDDTVAIENAMVAAKTIGVDFASGVVSEVARWGSIPFGGTVQLRSGHGYLVRNTQTRFDNGKLGAITVPRRCGLKGGGISQTHIYLAPGNIGHGIANANAGVVGGGWDDFMTLSDFTLFCNHDLQPAGCLDGIHFNAAFNNYLKVDNFMFMQNIRVFEPKRNGFYISGRGEGVFLNLFVYSAFNYGFHITNHMDSRFAYCNAGGCQKAGFYLEKCANDHFTNCKSFYNGAGGGTNLADSANFALVADSFLNGQVVMTSCESQEARGSGYYIQNGLNQLTSCLSADPGRVPIGGDPRPSVMAGFHIAQTNTAHQNAKHNVFIDCVVRPSLTLDYGDANNSAIYCGTHAVYIDDYCLGNKGNIWTYENASYSVAKVGGTGTTNGKNTKLKIDGEILFSAFAPDQVTGLTISPKNASALVSWSRPYYNGSALTDYVVQYKLTSEPTIWTTFADGANTNLNTTVTGLTNGSSYDFRVSAVNAIGTGTTSPIASTTPFVAVPSQVTGLTATADRLSVNLTWTAPADNNSPITDYVVEYKLASEPTIWTTYAEGTNTNTSVSVIGLPSALSHNFRVRAVNAIGAGTNSATSSATPLSFSPVDYGAAVWYDTSDAASVSLSGSNITQINDKSGNARHGIPTNSGTRPTYTTQINSLNVMNFSGTQDIVLPASLHAIASSDSVVIGMMKTGDIFSGGTNLMGSSGANYSVQLNGGSNRVEGRHHSSTTVNNDVTPNRASAMVLGMRRSGTSLDVFGAGTNSNNSSGAQNTSPTGLFLGGNYLGQMGDFAIFPALTNNQLEIVKYWLRNKYNAL